MGGAGKSYLVDRFYAESKGRFPGGYIRLALDPENPAGAAELLAQIADRLKLPAAIGARWRLGCSRRSRSCMSKTRYPGGREAHRRSRHPACGVRADRERARDHARHGRVVADGAAAIV